MKAGRTVKYKGVGGNTVVWPEKRVYGKEKWAFGGRAAWRSA